MVETSKHITGNKFSHACKISVLWKAPQLLLYVKSSMFTLYQITFALALDLLSVNSYVTFFTVSVCIVPDSFLSHYKKLTQCYYNIHVAQAINAAKALSVH